MHLRAARRVHGGERLPYAEAVEPTEQNRRAWDDIHRRRPVTSGARVALPDLVLERLPELQGKHVLHLQCGTGELTAELVALGALVTAVDSSREALELARERAPDAAFVHADVQELPVELRRGRFDLVFAADGVLSWLTDLEACARAVDSALRPGGEVLVFDEHPVARCLDGLMHWRYDYFDDSGGLRSEGFGVSPHSAPEPAHERFWRLGQVVSALAGAGLAIRALDESPAQRSWRRHDARVPGKFLLVAAKRA